MAEGGMIVSILQLMGFPMGKPVHSRAGEAPQKTPTKGAAAVEATTHEKQARSTRRDQVKAKPGKNPKAKVETAKVKATAKPAGKPVAKTPVKSVKVAAKAVAKPVAKPVKAKPVAQKASAKSASPSSKPVTKTAAKAMPKSPATKAVAKSEPKASAKAPAKKPAKPVTPVAGKTAKAITPVAPSKSAASSKPAAKPAPSEKVSAPMTVAVSKPASVSPAPTAVVQKTGRPSSRLAQLTVPSMAQSVASTAAKASYSQSVSLPVIVPVLPSSIKKDPKLANNWKTKPLAELTDADLMAMPDSEYMNDVQMAAFRLKLSTLKQEILNSAGETTEHLREDTSVVPDPADRATIEEEHALELRTRDRERKLLKKIEQSIGRIDSGDYGYCDETGEPIGVGRLLARPTATLSLEAQQRRELKQRMFGD
jgi:DnaK suppressor protein